MSHIRVPRPMPQPMPLYIFLINKINFLIMLFHLFGRIPLRVTILRIDSLKLIFEITFGKLHVVAKGGKVRLIVHSFIVLLQLLLQVNVIQGKFLNCFGLRRDKVLFLVEIKRSFLILRDREVPWDRWRERVNHFVVLEHLLLLLVDLRQLEIHTIVLILIFQRLSRNKGWQLFHLVLFVFL